MLLVLLLLPLLALKLRQRLPQRAAARGRRALLPRRARGRGLLGQGALLRQGACRLLLLLLLLLLPLAS